MPRRADADRHRCAPQGASPVRLRRSGWFSSPGQPAGPLRTWRQGKDERALRACPRRGRGTDRDSTCETSIPESPSSFRTEHAGPLGLLNVPGLVIGALRAARGTACGFKGRVPWTACSDGQSRTAAPTFLRDALCSTLGHGNPSVLSQHAGGQTCSVLSQRWVDRRHGSAAARQAGIAWRRCRQPPQKVTFRPVFGGGNWPSLCLSRRP